MPGCTFFSRAQSCEPSPPSKGTANCGRHASKPGARLRTRAGFTGIPSEEVSEALGKEEIAMDCPPLSRPRRAFPGSAAGRRGNPSRRSPGGTAEVGEKISAKRFSNLLRLIFRSAQEKKPFSRPCRAVPRFVTFHASYHLAGLSVAFTFLAFPPHLISQGRLAV